MKISLIIPVYNVERYIEQCIMSCINQQDFPIDEYEVIVINDGSPDRSLEIINNINWHGIRHKIIVQENMGLSMARNNGLKVAEGEYVWFIDSDDWIAFDALKTISKYFTLNVDAITINAANVKDEAYEKRFDYKLDSSKIYSGKYLIKKHKWYCAAQFTIYKKVFLSQNNLYFKPGIFHEDMEFTPRAYYFLESICVENTILYYTRQNPESITRKFNSKKNFDLLVVADSLIRFKDNYVAKKYQLYYRQLISLIVNSSLNNNKTFSAEERKKLISIYQDNKKLLLNLIGSGKIKYFCEGLLFLCFTSKILSIYNILKNK